MTGHHLVTRVETNENPGNLLDLVDRAETLGGEFTVVESGDGVIATMKLLYEA